MNNKQDVGTIKFKLEPGAISPSVGSEDAACFDLYALEDTHFCPGEIKIVKTGVRMEPPNKNLRANIYVRSSTPKNKGFILANSVGIIDTDYRGELGVQLMNVKTFKRFEQLEQDGPFVETAIFVSNSIKRGDKIAQLELVSNCSARNYEVQYVTELSETKRGEGGFGSTGN